MPRVIATAPLDLCRDELAEIVEHIEWEAQADPVLVERKLMSAALLLLLRQHSDVVGTACLTRPSATYRRSQFAFADVGDIATSFSLEFDLMTISGADKRLDYARLLVDMAVKSAFGVGVFAVARSNELRRLFEERHFEQAGSAFVSRAHPMRTSTIHVYPATAASAGHRGGRSTPLAHRLSKRVV